MRYQFRPVGYGTTADFYVYASHYKASTGAANEAERNVEARAIRADADAIGQGASIIYAGDLNFYTSSESGFQTLTGTGNGQAFDPISRVGSWSGSTTYKDVHTQSPATTGVFNGQVTGGMDDRFDFQLITDEVRDGGGFDYIAGSYWAFGNTATHAINQAISTGSAATLAARIPGYTTTQAQTVLTSLTQVTDHLPVLADYQLPAKMTATLAPLPTRVIRGGTVSATLTVANSAPVAVAAGADQLDYAYIGGGRGGRERHGERRRTRGVEHTRAQPHDHIGGPAERYGGRDRLESAGDEPHVQRHDFHKRLRSCDRLVRLRGDNDVADDRLRHADPWWRSGEQFLYALQPAGSLGHGVDREARPRRGVFHRSRGRVLDHTGPAREPGVGVVTRLRGVDGIGHGRHLFRHLHARPVRRRPPRGGVPATLARGSGERDPPCRRRHQLRRLHRLDRRGECACRQAIRHRRTRHVERWRFQRRPAGGHSRHQRPTRRGSLRPRRLPAARRRGWGTSEPWRPCPNRRRR